MVNYFIYAKDFSASTFRRKYYHKNGLETLKQFKSDVENIKNKLTEPEESRIIYLHWAYECFQVDEETAVQAYVNCSGDGFDTLPETIIEWIKHNIGGEIKIKLMYIITDGLIGSHSLRKCLKLNENVAYENIVFHGINENVSDIDLSVAASFIKGHCTIYRNSELLDQVDVSEEFDYDKLTIHNFATERDNLTSYIKFKFINSSKNNATALAEIEKLKKLRNRLFASLSSRSNTSLDTRDKNTFISELKNTPWYRNLTNQSSDLKTGIEKFVCTLINYIVSEKKSYAFDALKFETQYRTEVTEEPIADVDFPTDQEIEFPDIILDDEKGIPVILCTELNLLDKIIFHSSTSSSDSVSTASFSKFKSTMDCPLFLLSDVDVNESIGYFYTLNVYKQLLEKTMRTEPRTRKRFHGGLVLVDSDDFDAYNDYILSATYFNFKKVYYNVGLFYFVLWKICEKKQWMDKNVVEKFKNYMLRRISTTVCKIALSSLKLDPPEKTSLPTALWYCVEISSHIFKDDTRHFAHERLRMYYSVAHSMIEILGYLQYDLDLAFVNRRIDLIRHVMVLKKIPARRDKIYYLLEKIFKNVNGFLVCEIENQANVMKLNYLKLNHKEMLSDDEIMGEINMDEYVHFMHNTNEPDIIICKETFRPFFMIDQHKSFYGELYKIAKKVVVNNVNGQYVISYDALDKLGFDRILSFYNLFVRCVEQCEKFPTLTEYTDYILKKKSCYNDKVTVFANNVYKEIEKAFQSYGYIVRNVSVSEFIEVSRKYVNRIERIKGEGVRKFENDDEIRKFISSEEQKVHLQNLTSKEEV